MIRWLLLFACLTTSVWRTSAEGIDFAGPASFGALQYLETRAAPWSDRVRHQKDITASRLTVESGRTTSTDVLMPNRQGVVIRGELTTYQPSFFLPLAHALPLARFLPGQSIRLFASVDQSRFSISLHVRNARGEDFTIPLQTLEALLSGPTGNPTSAHAVQTLGPLNDSFSLARILSEDTWLTGIQMSSPVLSTAIQSWLVRSSRSDLDAASSADRDPWAQEHVRFEVVLVALTITGPSGP